MCYTDLRIGEEHCMLIIIEVSNFGHIANLCLIEIRKMLTANMKEDGSVIFELYCT